MEFITLFLKVQGRDCIYMLMDRLNKYAHLFSIYSVYSACQVAYLFFREVLRLHGLPKNIVSDQDKTILHVFW
jgi:hypothetical protein